MPALLDWILLNEANFRQARLPSLYSDFSVQRSTNPDGYAANVSAWQTALSHAARAGVIQSASGAKDLLVLQTNEQLLRGLDSHEYGRPSGIAMVLDDAVQKGTMIPMDHFLASPTSIYSKSWLPSPWQIVNWTLRQIGLGHTYSGPTLKASSLVIVANLEDVSAEVVAHIQERSSGLTDRVMALESFQEELSRLLGVQQVSKADLTALLRYLQRDKGLISYDDKTLKFKSPSATSPEPLTSQDATIASIKLLISHLNVQCASLSDRITTLSSTARQAVKNSNRVSAQSALRSKKIAESTLNQRSATLHQLEEVYAKLEQAVDQVEVIRVMEASTKTLKGLNKQIGSVERVEDVIEDLREEMSKVDEVSGVIREPLTIQAAINEDELDDELEAMEKEEKDKKEEHGAEETRKRLEEVGMAAEEPAEAVTEQKAEEEIENAAKRLSDMSIDGPTKELQPQGQTFQDRREAEAAQ